MSTDTSKMEEVINKPDDQFEDTLIDLIDYSKETSEKEALIKEIYRNEGTSHHNIKPAASLNSSTYSSAASSSSSSSSNSSTKSTSSTSSTLTSPSQSNPNVPKSSNDQDKDNSTKANTNKYDDVEMATLEDLGKTATIIEHRVCSGEIANYFRTLSAAPPIQQPTIHKNSGLRKKRPVEQPVLSQDIPGHRGEQEVDLLVNFIESGTTSQQSSNKKNGNNTSSNNNSTKKAKSQPKKAKNERDVQQVRKPRPIRTQKEAPVSKPEVKTMPNKCSQVVDEKLSEQKPSNNAVTFADHIKISDEDETAQYTFGFFDEQKPKVKKTSPIGDRRRYMFNDNIDANSFNYQQILEFISKSWNKTVAMNMTKAS